MPRRGENIRKRKDGRWEGRYKAKNIYADECRYVSVYGKTYAEVKAKLKTAQESPIVRTSTALLFQDLLSLWIHSRRSQLKETTVNRYEFLIQRHILPELGNVPLEKLDAPVINRFLESKRNCGNLEDGGKLSPAYVRSIAVVIQSAIRYASAEGIRPPIAGNICKPPLNKSEIRILSYEEQLALEHGIYDQPDVTGIGVLLALYGGLRIGEVCALNWEDVDLRKGIIHIRHTVARVKNRERNQTDLILNSPKTMASLRIVPIHQVLLPILENAFRSAISPFVVSNTDTFVSPRTFTYRFHRLLKKCGLPPIHFHTLRHTFATRCIAAGIDPKTLSEMMGHASVAITMNTYVHPSLEVKQQQLKKLEAILLPVCGQKLGQLFT